MVNEDAKIRKRLLIGSAVNLFGLLLIWAAQNFIAEDFWPAAFLLFAPQFLFTLPTLALMALCRLSRHSRLALLQIPALMLLLFGFLSFNIPRHAASTEEDTIRVMTYNIRFASLGVERVLETIQDQQPDVICIQESSAEDGFPDPTPFLTENLSGYHVAQYRDLLVFSRFPILFLARRRPREGNNTSVLEARLDVGGKPLTVFCVHLSNPLSRTVIAWPGTKKPRAALRARGRQVAFLSRLTRRAKTPFLLAGDFNMPPRGVLYRQLSQHYRDGFRDSGWGFGYSYPARLPIARIDYVWAGKGTRVLNCRVIRSTASDHRPIIAEVALE